MEKEKMLVANHNLFKCHFFEGWKSSPVALEEYSWKYGTDERNPTEEAIGRLTTIFLYH